MSETVSIIIPVRNAEKYIERCLASLQAQSYDNLEILMVLNDSSDGSEAICRQIASADTRIKVITSNLAGVSRARNLGIDAASGAWVTFIDADDFIGTDLIRHQIIELETKNVDIATTSIEKYDVSALGGYCKKGTDKTVSSHDYIQKMLLGTPGYYGYSCCKIYRAEALAGIRFDENLSFSEDTDFLLRLLKKDLKVYVSPFVGYFYSQDTGGVTKDTAGTQRIKALQLSKKFIHDANSVQIRIAAESYCWRNAYYALSQSPDLSSVDKEEAWAIIKKYRTGVIAGKSSPLKYRLIATTSLLGQTSFIRITSKLTARR